MSVLRKPPSFWGGHFLYSSSSSYPEPTAVLINDGGEVVHTWSHGVDQVPQTEDPPSFLRGWNHVALDQDGLLVALVPLCSVLAMDRDSQIVWRSPVAAHHDITFTLDGRIVVLTEVVQQTPDTNSVVLDSHITALTARGEVSSSRSLYTVLVSHPVLRDLVERATIERLAAFESVRHLADPESVQIFKTGDSIHPVRDTLRMLRQLPGSPADVLHANALQVLSRHPLGLWPEGSMLVSFRNLDLLVVIDPYSEHVLWWWGPGLLSGQHQPTALPNGRILIFDNGVNVGRSRVLEVDTTGRDITWSYEADPPESFFTALAGGCELLPNGNLLITNSRSGSAFQITRSGEPVWSWSAPEAQCRAGGSRVSLYRLTAVPPSVVSKLLTKA